MRTKLASSLARKVFVAAVAARAHNGRTIPYRALNLSRDLGGIARCPLLQFVRCAPVVLAEATLVQSRGYEGRAVQRVVAASSRLHSACLHDLDRLTTHVGHEPPCLSCRNWHPAGLRWNLAGRVLRGADGSLPLRSDTALADITDVLPVLPREQAAAARAAIAIGGGHRVAHPKMLGTSSARTIRAEAALAMRSARRIALALRSALASNAFTA